VAAQQGNAFGQALLGRVLRTRTELRQAESKQLIPSQRVVVQLDRN
jgi:hypothetical protein